MDKSPHKHILALVPNWLGDAVMCTPALRAIHRRYPEAVLTVAGPGGPCELLRGLPWISDVVPFPARPGPAAMLKAGLRLRKHARDLAVVFPHSFRAALIARISGSREIAGYARGGRSMLLTRRVPPNTVEGSIEPVYMVWEYLDLVAELDCENDGFGPELSADPMAVAAVKEHLVEDGPIVGIAPGAAYGASKRWPAERFARVADALREQTGALCVLLTGPGEEKTRDEVVKAAKHPLAICDEGSPTIASLKATVSILDLLVCNDSGPRHVAVAFNKPAICIMCPTCPVYTEGPYERGRVLRVDVDCGPCQKPVCATDHRCMLNISPDNVLEAALEYLPKAKV